jgi:hypothetical protein
MKNQNKNENEVYFVWKDLKYSLYDRINKKKIIILDNLSGITKSGELTAIMGRYNEIHLII